MILIKAFGNDLSKLKIDDPSRISVLGNQNILGPDIAMDNTK
jgi:hypothetical protein